LVTEALADIVVVAVQLELFGVLVVHILIQTLEMYRKNNE
jgi:hypothetical protein